MLGRLRLRELAGLAASIDAEDENTIQCLPSTERRRGEERIRRAIEEMTTNTVMLGRSSVRGTLSSGRRLPSKKSFAAAAAESVHPAPTVNHCRRDLSPSSREEISLGRASLEAASSSSQRRLRRLEEAEAQCQETRTRRNARER